MYDLVNILVNISLIMDGQVKSKRLCRSTVCERDMLSNWVKHKLDAWWLVIFLLLLKMRELDKLKSKLK